MIDGTQGEIVPGAVGSVLKSVFLLLDAIDKRSWKVGTPRVKWRISEAKLVNPLTITATGVDAFPEYGSTEVAFGLVKSLREIENGRRPPGFSDQDLKNVRHIAKESAGFNKLLITGQSNGKAEEFQVHKSLSVKASSLICKPKQVRTEYGSIEGTLIELVNDPLDDDGSAILRSHVGGLEVCCHASPRMAGELAHYLNREARIALFGDITFEDGIAKAIHVEEFTSIPDESGLPTLDQLHALQLRPPGGRTVEDFLDEMRGDE